MWATLCCSVPMEASCSPTTPSLTEMHNSEFCLFHWNFCFLKLTVHHIPEPSEAATLWYSCFIHLFTLWSKQQVELGHCVTSSWLILYRIQSEWNEDVQLLLELGRLCEEPADVFLTVDTAVVSCCAVCPAQYSSALAQRMGRDQQALHRRPANLHPLLQPGHVHRSHHWVHNAAS